MTKNKAKELCESILQEDGERITSISESLRSRRKKLLIAVMVMYIGFLLIFLSYTKISLSSFFVQHAWAIIGGITVLSSGVYVASQMRTRLLKKEERFIDVDDKRRSHVDDIFVKHLIEKVESLKRDTANIDYDKIEKSIKKSLESSKKQIWI